MTSNSSSIGNQQLSTAQRPVLPAAASPAIPTLTGAQEISLLAVLTSTNFVVMTCINMLAPLLIEISTEFNTTVGSVGQLAAATAIPWAALAPFMGVLSDRYGKRPVLTLGLTLLGIATIASAFSWNYGSLMAFRLIGGIGGATTGPNILSAPADYFPPHRSGRAMGFVLGGLSVATVVGVPTVAVIAAAVGWRSAFLVVGALLLVLAATIWTALPTTARKAPGSGYISGFATVLASRSTLLLLFANLMERCSFVATSTYLAAFLMQSYGLRLDQVAPILSAIAAGTLLGSIFGGRLADMGRQRTQYAALLLVTAVLIFPVFAATPGLFLTAVLAAAFGIFGSLARPAWLWLITRVPAERRGTTTGFAATSNQMGIVLGSAVGGLLVGAGGYWLVGALAAGAAVVSAATCILSKES